MPRTPSKESPKTLLREIRDALKQHVAMQKRLLALEERREHSANQLVQLTLRSARTLRVWRTVYLLLLIIILLAFLASLWPLLNLGF